LKKNPVVKKIYPAIISYTNQAINLCKDQILKSGRITTGYALAEFDATYPRHWKRLYKNKLLAYIESQNTVFNMLYYKIFSFNMEQFVSTIDIWAPFRRDEIQPPEVLFIEAKITGIIGTVAVEEQFEVHTTTTTQGLNAVPTTTTLNSITTTYLTHMKTEKQVVLLDNENIFEHLVEELRKYTGDGSTGTYSVLVNRGHAFFNTLRGRRFSPREKINLIHLAIEELKVPLQVPYNGSALPKY